MEKTILDLINSFGFEFASCFFLAFNIWALYRDKMVKGVSLISQSFYVLWAWWNVYYYFSLDQPFSFFIGIFVAILSCWWVGLAIWYSKKDFTK